jgi:hypothetical protein
MSKRDIIEGLLKNHDGFLGTGNMKMASRQIPLLIRALLDYVEEIDDRKSAPAKQAEMDNLLATIREKNITIPPVLAVEEPAKPCPPCDVTETNPEPEKRIDFEALKTSKDETLYDLDTALAEVEKAEEELIKEDAIIEAEGKPGKTSKKK